MTVPVLIAPNRLVLPCVMPTLSSKDEAIFVISGPDGEWSARSSEAWFVVDASATVSGGWGQFGYQYSSNQKDARQSVVTISPGDGKVLHVEVEQEAGSLVEQQTSALVTAPMILEFVIALDFIAQQVAKLPPPVEAAAIALVEALIPVIGEILYMMRLGFISVPMLPPVLPSADAPTGVMVTQTLILNQVARFEAYFPQAVAEQG